MPDLHKPERNAIRAAATEARQQMLELGQRINAEMKDQHISLRQLADKTGISHITLHHVRRGVWMLTDDQLVEVCRQLAIK